MVYISLPYWTINLGAQWPCSLLQHDWSSTWRSAWHTWGLWTHPESPSKGGVDKGRRSGVGSWTAVLVCPVAEPRWNPGLLFHSATQISCLFWFHTLLCLLGLHASFSLGMASLCFDKPGTGVASWFPPHPHLWPSQDGWRSTVGWLWRQNFSFELVNKSGTWFLKTMKSKTWFSRGVQHFKVYKISINIVSFDLEKCLLRWLIGWYYSPFHKYSIYS